MFEEGPKSITRSQESKMREAKTAGRIMVTDGSGSFYSSRTMIQTLHDFGSFTEISAFGVSIAESKKMLLTRQSRYSGLNDVLTFEEGEVTTAFSGAAAWLAINANEAELPAQIAAATAAGISRIFLLLSSSLDDMPSVEALLAASGAEYTLMRTGTLVEDTSAGGLKLDDIEMPVCEDVSKEDVFRFVTEALTLPEASARSFSLCPSTATVDSLKQVRYAGYERREEVQMLLSGLIKEQGATEPTAEEAAEKEEAVMRSSAEVEAEREGELKMLLERARKRGEETQARLQFEAIEKEKQRQEMATYYQSPSAADEGEGGGDASSPDSPPPSDDDKA